MEAALKHLERICSELYAGQSSQSRMEAELLLKATFPSDFSHSNAHIRNTDIFGFVITSPSDGFLLCQQLLNASTSHYVVTYLVMYLRKLVDSHFKFLSLDQKLSLRIQYTH